jgi:hypothetical protein
LALYRARETLGSANPSAAATRDAAPDLAIPLGNALFNAEQEAYRFAAGVAASAEGMTKVVAINTVTTAARILFTDAPVGPLPGSDSSVLGT